MNYLKIINTGELIPFYSANLSMDKSSYCWTFNADIADIDNLDKLKPRKSLRGDYVEVEFKLGLTTWRLIIEKTAERTTSHSFRVTGRSPSVFLTDNYSTQITQTWTNTTTQSIINELCTNVGVTLSFLINDWRIDSYSVTDRYPMDIISELAGEKKAVINSLPDGTLCIVPNLPCSPKHINEQAHDFYIATDKNIFDRGHEFDNRKNTNKVTVTKQTNTLTDTAPSVSIEETTDGKDILLNIIVNPFIADITLSHSSGSHVAVYHQGIKYKTITDQLIIYDGKAKLSKPFSQLKSLAWHQTELADLVIDSLGNVTTGTGFSVVTIEYLSPYHQYRVQRLNDITLTGIKIDDITPPSNLSALTIEIIVAGTQGDKPLPAIVVNTLATQLDLLERGQQELWNELLDIDQYSIECAYENAPLLPAKIAQVLINKTAEVFNAYIKSVSIQINTTITQSITIERPLL